MRDPERAFKAWLTSPVYAAKINLELAKNAKDMYKIVHQNLILAKEEPILVETKMQALDEAIRSTTEMIEAPTKLVTSTREAVWYRHFYFEHTGLKPLVNTIASMEYLYRRPVPCSTFRVPLPLTRPRASLLQTAFSTSSQNG